MVDVVLLLIVKSLFYVCAKTEAIFWNFYVWFLNIKLSLI